MCILFSRDIQEQKSVSSEGIPSGSLEEIEKEAIRDALARCQGNRTKAAEELGVSRKTILNKIKMYGLP